MAWKRCALVVGAEDISDAVRSYFVFNRAWDRFPTRVRDDGKLISW